MAEALRLEAELARFYECERNARCIIDRSLTGYDPPEEHPLPVYHKSEA
jgi:hypothetical protein